MSAKQHRIYFKLQIAARSLQKQADRLLLESGGITTAQAAVLILVQTNNNTTQRELAQQLQQNESAITGMISRLQELKLLVKKRSSVDARAWTLSITRKGNAALELIKTPFAKLNRQIEEQLGLDNLSLFAENLSAIAAINVETKE